MAGKVSQKILKTIFQIRRDTAANWDAINPVLRCGEPGFAYDTLVFKVGNGVDHWKDLGTSSSLDVYLENIIQRDEVEMVIDCGSATRNV